MSSHQNVDCEMVMDDDVTWCNVYYTENENNKFLVISQYFDIYLDQDKDIGKYITYLSLGSPRKAAWKLITAELALSCLTWYKPSLNHAHFPLWR